MHLLTTAGAGRRTRRALLAAVLAAGAPASGAVAHPGAVPTCFGESGFDIVGTGQNDTRVGTPGHDRIYGLGDDELYAGAGDDALDGQEGTDSCENGERDQGCELP